MLEIFDKARDYARLGMTGLDFHKLACELKIAGQEDQWRLHQQAFKLFKFAQDYCAKRRELEPQSEPMSNIEVLEQLNCMEAKYGAGWSQEGEWYIKDYQRSEDLIDTLGFFRRMGVHYTRKDNNPLSDALHLRVSNDDFDLIFNPVADVRHRGLGRS